MLGELEMRVLQTLQEDQSITALSEQVSRDRGDVSRAVSHLEERGLAHTRRAGKEKLVSPGDTRVVELLQRLIHTHPHVDFPSLLSGKAFPILFHLDEPNTVSDLAEKTGNYRNTVHRIVKRLLDRGILQKLDSRYVLNDEFRILQELASALVHHQHQQTASNQVSSFTILWETFDEFLVQTTEEIDHDAYHESGPAHFQQYGIPLLTTNERYYLYSEERAITPEELVCHTLLIEDSTRYRTYCLLLIEKEGLDRDTVLGAAERYGVADTVERLFDYLETRGRQTDRDFPAWEEFRATAREYGVAL